MRRTQKFLSVFLALMMVISIVPITASAAPDLYSGSCGDSLTWSYDETTGTLTISGEGVMYDFPYDDSQWFDLKSEITNVVIEEGVTSIGDSAFELFVNLKNVTIPESVTSIGAYAFDECDSITNIVLHEGVTKIGDGAFSNCDYLDTVVIPGTVTEFGDYVFASCDRLANVTLCDGLTDIGLDTFNNCISLTDIVIPEGVTSLRGENFAGCVNLKSITFPVSITDVGYGVFGDCVNLQDVYYTGTEEDILNLHPGAYNAPLLAATIHCDSTVHRHNYVKTGEYVAEFCDEDGYTTYACECGHSYKGDYVKATEHSYDNGVVTTKPTCDVDGVKTFTCTACGDTYTEAVPQTGHSYDDGVITTDPTCATDGVKTFTCENCGDTYTEAVDKVEGHSYQLVVNTSPDTGCVKTYKCSGCGDTYKEAVGTTHTQVATPEFAPTETKPGLTVGISCSSCGAVLLEQEIIPALGTTEDASVIVSGNCGTNATWTYNTETCALVISGTGAMERYKSTQSKPWQKYEDEIKTIVINNGITKIDNYTFDSCSALMYVSIPDSVTTIGNYVFRSCNNLRSVTIPEGVTSIGDELFKNCKNLLNVEIGNKVSQIGASAFYGCSSLTEITIPDSAYYIYASAFENCANLKSVTIGKNVETIYSKAFSGCTALTDVYYTGTEEQWKTISIGTGNDPLLKATNRYDGAGGDILSGHNNHKNTVTTIEPTCTEAGYTKFVCECGYEYTVNYDALGHSEEEIPPVLPTSSRVGYTRGKKCTTCGEIFVEPVVVPIIGETARAGDAGYNVIWVYNEATLTMEFYGKGYMKYYDPVVYASNDSDDRPWAVYGYSKIQQVVIHEGIEGINAQNFYRFTSLKIISLPSTLERIVDDAFEGCEDFYVKYNGTREDWDKIDGHLTNYDRIIFNDYSGVTASGTHGDNLSWNFDATTFTLTIYGTGPMESVAYNEYPWYEYIPEIENIVIKEGVTTIGESAFYECGFENITIPNTVTTIGKSAFMHCDNYKSITIPSSVTKIGETAFFPKDVFRYKLAEVYYLGTEEMWNNISVGQFGTYIFQYATIHFVKYAGYCGHNLTYSFDGSTLILTGTGDMCEFEMEWDEHVYSPWEDWALEIEHIVIGDGITSISDDAFHACGSKLQTVTFGSDVKKIGAYAFYWCKSLTEIIFPDGLTVIGKYAFYNSTSIKSIVLPDSIEEIGYCAFGDCTGITDVHYQGTESQWNEINIDSNNKELINARIHYNYGKSFTGIKDNHFYKDDVMQKAYQLVEFDGNFYYIGDRHEIVKDKKVYIKAERTNGLTFADGTPISAGWYDFDIDGKMIILDGIVGNKVYKNNVQLKAYQLVEVDGEFYYIGDRHEIVKDKKVYIKAERTNGLTFADGTPITAGYYDFDENGKMIILDGVVGNKVYKNNVQLKAYQLVEVDGEFYYIGDRHEIVKDKKVFIKAERTNSLTFADGTPIQAGWYNFDADGKLVIE